MFLNNVISYLHSLNPDFHNKDNSHIEIEIKLLLDKRIKVPYFIKIHEYPNDLKNKIMDIIQNALKYGISDISQTINFINTTNKNGMFVKQLHFINGIQDKDKKNYYYKKPLVPPFYMMGNDISYKFTINMETVEQNDINMFDITRFRLRYTITFNAELVGWKLDLTFIKETRDSSLGTLKIIRDKLFSKQIPIYNLLNDFDWDYPDRIELELEYIDDIKNININRIAKAINILKKHENPNLQEPLLNFNYSKLLMTYENCICEIAQIIKPKLLNKFKSGQFGLKQLGSNPIELNKNLYITNIVPNIQNFIITEKIDGIRSMLIIYPQDGICYIINNKNKDGFSIKHITYDKTGIFANVKCIILDSEAIESKNFKDVVHMDTTNSKTNYYIFDIIKYDIINYDIIKYDIINHDIKKYNTYTTDESINVSIMPFSKRLEYIKLIVDHSNELLIDGDAFIYAKHFMELHKDSYNTSIKSFYDDMSNLHYDIDGLIIISKNDNYEKTLNYKWKPKLTIDFVAKKCPDNMLGISPYIIKEGKTLYLLFCGIRSNEYKQFGIERFKLYDQMFTNICVNKYGKTNDSYMPIQFAPSSDPYAYLFWSDNDSLNNNVIELLYDTNENEWTLLKIRHDRVNDLNRKTYYGNNFKVAELIWMNYKNPVTIDTLCQNYTLNINSKSYFKHESTEYFAMRKFNNYVKKEIINSTSNQIDLKWVIELASGKGQDLQKYIDGGFQNILMTDIDSDALSEIINRKHKYISDSLCYKTNAQKPKKTNNKFIKIYIKKLNLLDSYLINTDLVYASQYGIPLDGVKLVVCNLALHYIVSDKLKSQNFVNFLDKILAPGGIFIFTAFNGEKVFNLLNEHSNNNGKWNKYDDAGKLLYSIKKKYNGNFTGSNQQIDVLLPFTNGEYYTESLININVLNTQLEKKKISLMASDSFETYLTKFCIDKNNFYKQLTIIDKEYISLYHFHIYHKQNTKVNYTRNNKSKK